MQFCCKNLFIVYINNLPAVINMFVKMLVDDTKSTSVKNMLYNINFK